MDGRVWKSKADYTNGSAADFPRPSPIGEDPRYPVGVLLKRLGGCEEADVFDL
jgi:hypothetical protein